MALTSVFAVACASSATTVAGAATPHATPRTAPASVSKPLEDQPSNIVEDFSYPGAAQILATRGITLKKGDGHILLVDCVAGDATQIVVDARARPQTCFHVTGPVGDLTLQIPRTYDIRGGDRNLTATLTPEVSGDDKTYDVAAGQWTSVGETDVGGYWALMEIRVG
ncbi:hypothetical protein OG738_34535 [Amycolatopsis sp. NBC_01488]|uniref:hypothetical protein n=1 Tax=Amycolatopsis sp. NBC_01488 TaxID=2903563 RepID=UPI002E2BB0C2|nr:hypothetical protein [Amycolatopsis sp. NBC_01488]